MIKAIVLLLLVIFLYTSTSLFYKMDKIEIINENKTVTALTKEQELPNGRNKLFDNNTMIKNVIENANETDTKTENVVSNTTANIHQTKFENINEKTELPTNQTDNISKPKSLKALIARYIKGNFFIRKIFQYGFKNFD